MAAGNITAKMAQWQQAKHKTNCNKIQPKRRKLPKNKEKEYSLNQKRRTRPRKDPAHWALKVNKNTGFGRGRNPWMAGPGRGKDNSHYCWPWQRPAKWWSLCGWVGWLDIWPFFVLRPWRLPVSTTDIRMNAIARARASGSDPRLSPPPNLATGMPIEPSPPAPERFKLFLPIDTWFSGSVIVMPQEARYNYKFRVPLTCTYNNCNIHS